MDAGDIASVVEAADIVISVCPPHGAVALADAFTDAPGTTVDEMLEALLR